MSKKANTLHNRFLAAVTHDLRNPIYVIQINSAIINHELSNVPGGDRVRKQVATIQRAVGIMQNLVEDLLDIETIQTGRITLNKQKCFIKDLFFELAELYGPLTNASGQVLEYKVESNVECVIDKHRVLQVLGNLIGNAIKWTPRDGYIRLVARGLDNEVAFCVTNSGSSIPKDQYQNIFEAFTQDEESKEHHIGKGLGLFIATWLVEIHGGKIWVESNEQERTTTFCFNLPH